MAHETYYPRELAGEVDRALRIFPLVVISGPRQSGKTTMIREEEGLSGRAYFTLDELDLLNTARTEPEALLEAADEVTIDEAQRAPELFLTVKRLVDKKRRPGQFLLSGSANFQLLSTVSDTLAGRACYLTLSPFTAREVNRTTGKKPFIVSVLSGGSIRGLTKGRPVDFSSRDILKGGFPVPRLLRGDAHIDWFRAYEQTYIERDIRQLSQVADLAGFRTVLHLAALRTGQLLNQSELGRDAGLNAMTTARYLSLLETSWILHRLPTYYRSRTKQIVKSPKLYVTDSGLAAFLCGVDHLSDIREPLRGPLLETYMAQNLSAILGAHLPEARLNFWRKHRGGEVDFVISMGDQALAIEVKWSSRVKPSDWKSLKEFMSASPHCVAGILAYSGREAHPLGKKLWAVPLPTVWS